jgi:hypothetical protein
VTHFYSGQPMHFYSGVDSDGAIATVTMIQEPWSLWETMVSDLAKTVPVNGLHPGI